MVASTNPDAVEFDELYDAANDENDSRWLARRLLIDCKHDAPDEFVTVKD